MHNLVECNCCNEIKECITCEYNHNICLNCKVNSGLPFDICFFCNPIRNAEQRNEEQNEINVDNEINYTTKEIMVIIISVIVGCLVICIAGAYLLLILRFLFTGESVNFDIRYIKPYEYYIGSIILTVLIVIGKSMRSSWDN